MTSTFGMLSLGVVSHTHSLSHLGHRSSMVGKVNLAITWIDEPGHINSHTLRDVQPESGDPMMFEIAELRHRTVILEESVQKGRV